MPAHRPTRPRVITGGLALAGGLGFGLYAALLVGQGAEAAVLACAAALAMLAAGLATGIAGLVGWGAGVLGAAYVGALVARGTGVDAAAPAAAALLLAVAELGFWSLQCRVPSADAPSMHRRRAAMVGVEAVLAAIVGAVCVLGASVTAGGGAAALIAIAALLLVMVAIAALAWRARGA